MGRPMRRKHLRTDESFWSWLDSSNTPMHVAAVAVFECDGEPAATVVERIRSDFRMRADIHPRFRTVIRLRRFPLRARREVVDHIDLDLHVRHHVLAESDSEHALAQFISQLQSVRLDAARPMWELHIIEIPDSNCFALYVKAHHALINGVDAVRMLSRSLATTAEVPTATPLWTIDGPRPQLTSPGGDRLRASPHNRATILAAATKAAARLYLPRHLPRRRSSRLTGPWAASRAPINVGPGPWRRIRTVSLDLSKLKRLAHVSGTSLNDIALAICSAALRRHLLDIGDLPATPLIAGCPVSIPAPAGSSDSSIGIMFVDLATDRDEFDDRLATIATSTTAAKTHQGLLPSGAVLPYSILAMGTHTLRQIMPGTVDYLPPTFNLIISNVPGPATPLYLCGARMIELHPLSLLFKGEALNITALSYDGRLNFGLTACASALPQVDLLARYMEDAADDLEAHYATATSEIGVKPEGAA